MFNVAKIQPTRTFCITAMPCEERLAGVKEGTLKSLKVANQEAIAFRYLQNSAGLSRSMLEVVGSLIVASMAWLYTLPIRDDDIKLVYKFFFLTILIGNAIVSYRNALGYAHLKKLTFDWLSSNVSPDCLNEIQKTSYKKPLETLRLHRFFTQNEDPNAIEKNNEYLPTKVKSLILENFNV